MGLKKTATLKDIIVHYVTSVLGIGLIVSPSLSYFISGQYAIYIWILLAVISVPISFVFVWLSLRHGQASSIILFVKESLGNYMSQVISYCILLTMFIGNPIMSIVSSRYIINALNLPPEYFIICSIILIASSLILVTVKLSSFFIVQKVLIVLFITIFVYANTYSIHTNEYSMTIPLLNINNISIAMASFFVCFMAFTGWENGITIVEEIKNNTKYLYIGTIIASLILLFLYLLSFYAIQPYVDHALPENHSVLALGYLFESNFSTYGFFLINIIIPLILFLSSNSWMYGTSRMIYSMSSNKYLPKIFSYTSNTHGTPIYAIILMFIFYMLVLLIFHIFSLTEQSLIFLYSFGSFIIFITIFLSGVLVFHNFKKIISLLLFILFSTILIYTHFDLFSAFIFISLCLILPIINIFKKL